MSTARVTLAEVARKAGVSRTTASFVLSGRTDMRISADAQQRVLAAAEELGYRRNLTALSLRKGITRTIGLISDTVAASPYSGDVIAGALDTALKHDRLLFVAETGGDPDVERRLVDEMLDRQVDGLLYATSFTQHREPPAAVHGRPVVLLNCLAESCAAPSVIPDELEAGRTAAHALLDAGHRAGIFAIGGTHRTEQTPEGVYAGRERMRGIEEVLGAAGIALAGVVECAWHGPEYGYQAVTDLLDGGSELRALICLNDRVAFGAYECLRERGLRIPHDVSVVSFDDSDLASWLRPRLTSVALPHYELGAAAVTLLVEDRLDPQVLRLPMPIRTRDSVAAPANR